VFTEGEAPEPIYLTHLHRQHRQRVTIVIDDRHGAALTLVQHVPMGAAVGNAKSDAAEALASTSTGACSTTMRTPKLDEALDNACANEISVALSNPCIELRFVLRSADHAAFIDRHAVQARNRELYGFDRRPSVDALNQLAVRYPAAKKRAAALNEMHRRNESHERSNPSTSMPGPINSIFA
jgi:hypothetical protein